MSARQVAGRVLDLVFPPQCLRCRAMTERAGALCAECWGAVTFIGRPYCERCGLPFDYDLGAGALCGACVRTPPAYAKARAVLVYDDTSRDLVLAFKHADRTDAAPTYGTWLARAGGELMEGTDLVLPVPLHWTRLFGRRFNQAALLAQVLGRECGLAVAPDLLRRRRRTPSQGRLSPAQRRRNMEGAFAVPARGRAGLRGKRLLLVDDVLTTGATANACARVLRRAGAESVSVLTLARVLRAR